MDPNIILRELKKRFKNKIREVEMETGNQDLDLTRLLASAMNLNLFYMGVLVMIYKKGFAYDNTKPKYDRTLYDLKKLKRQLRRIKAALHGMNLEAGEDEDEDEKFATLQKWKHAGRNVVMFLWCFSLKAFFVLVWATIYQELYIP
ncbi:hypothetical protein C1H46_013848 [Malus baccata]|uniref:Uncharacterized protein n=1 Tax=Malus baccata TaxID=106549 RepID=A0A540MP92_MALBA|nr:hypothetical protein C1H46_013848 [Malus baccata]